MIGNTLGSYSIQRELGRGGMGAVYVGVHALLGRTAAVKVLLPDLSRNQDIVQRFFNEARAATAIRHPSIVEIYDFGYAQDGSAYIVMEYLEGEPLTSRLRRFGRVAPAFALAVARQVSGALAAAHRAGIVHRDLKPDNIFLVPDADTPIGERVKLLDFGIAKLAGDAGVQSVSRTSTGAILGTPYYMSPEQCRGAGTVDARSDLYSLGCVLFEMVCGRVPFPGEGAGEIIGAHLHVAPPTPHELVPEIPPELEQLILRLLAKKPEDRPQTADDVMHQISAVLSGPLPAMTSGAAGPSGVSGAPSHPGVSGPGSHSGVSGPAAATGSLPGTSSVSGTAATAIGTAPTTLGTASGQAATQPTLEAPRRGLGIYIAIAAGLAAAAAAAVIITTQAKDRGSPVAATPPPAALIDAASAAIEPSAVDAAGAPIRGDLEKLLVDARSALTSERWADAARVAKAALDVDGDNVEARLILDKANAEAPAEAAAEVIRKAHATGDVDAAMKALAEIPSTSIYKERVRADMEDMRDRYFEKVTPKIASLVKKQQCREARDLAGDAAKLWPKQAADLQKTARACKEPPGTAPPPAATLDAGVATPPPASDAGAAPAPPAPPGKPTPPKATIDQRIDHAAQLVKANDWEGALAELQGVLAESPKNRKAKLNAGIVACHLGKADLARGYLQGLTGPKVKALRKSCLTEPAPAPAKEKEKEPDKPKEPAQGAEQQPSGSGAKN